MSTRYSLPSLYAGFPGVAHGGILATLLDEVMAWSAIESAGRACVTGEMKIRYLKPVPVEEPLLAWGEPAEDRGRYLFCRGEVEGANGEVLVRAEGKFFPLPGEQSPRGLQSARGLQPSLSLAARRLRGSILP